MERSKAIVALAHVCQHWRATILSNPKFWTCVDLTHSFGAASLERSGSTPTIAAFITPNRATPIPPKEVLLQHSSKIQRVHIHASYEQLMKFLSNLCGHSPILEAVEIQHGPILDGRYPDSRTWMKEFKLPPALIDAPSLTSLRLSNVEFSDSFLDLHHLTHLELSNTDLKPCNHLPMISANPMLEVLIIRDRHPSFHQGHVYDREAIVPLPHLRRMELHYISAYKILTSLIFPRGTHLSWYRPPRDPILLSKSLLTIFTVQKAQITFTRSKKRECTEKPIRRKFTCSISGYGPNRTFRLSTEPVERHRFTNIPKIPPGSLELLAISSFGIGTKNPSPDEIVICFLEPSLSSFVHLRVLIAHRVIGCKAILSHLCNPCICPELHTVMLADYKPRAAYWSSLVKMARIRDQHHDSENIRRVDIICKANESPEPDQLVELMAHVSLVQVKPWECEVEELNWLKDPRFKDLDRL